MALELHIWGPAFGLPSIDPECNAAVAYLLLSLTSNNIEWHLIPNQDTTVSPNGEFPLLIDPSTSSRICSFSSIATYIASQYPAAGHPDAHLSAEQQADVQALTIFFRCHALPLLDLSLYTTSANYVGSTQPAFTAILPWYTNYTIPPLRRNAARQRVQHLGLASLDVETLHDDLDTLSGTGSGPGGQTISSQFDASKRAAEKRKQAPSLLPLGRARLRGLLGQAQYAEKFKLDRLAKACFEPLASQLGQKSYLMSDKHLTSIDCIAWGYLSLMLYPSCEQSWLRGSIENKFPRLYAYIQRLQKSTIGTESIDAAAVMTGSASHLKLSWRLPPKPSLVGSVTTAGQGLLSAISLPPLAEYLSLKAPSSSARSTITKLLSFSSLVLAVLAGAGYHFATINPDAWDYTFKPTDEEFASSSGAEPASRDYGPETFARGNALVAALREAMNPVAGLDPSQERERERVGGAPVSVVEVDVD